jgi:hypothetical protein
MLTQNEAGGVHVTLIDLGVAHLLTADKLTQVGTMIGTPHFMSPEQILGTAPMSPASDVFSLGVMLFELLARDRAYEGDDVVAVVAKIALTDAPRLSDVLADVPVDLDELLARSMAKRPADRFQTARELGEAIDALAPLTTKTEPSAAARLYGDEETERLSPLRSPSVASSPCCSRARPAAVSAGFALIAESLSGAHHRLLSLVEVAVFGARSRQATKRCGPFAWRWPCGQQYRLALGRVDRARPGPLAALRMRSTERPGRRKRRRRNRARQNDGTTAGRYLHRGRAPPRLAFAGAAHGGASHPARSSDPCVGREQELDAGTPVRRSGRGSFAGRAGGRPGGIGEIAARARARAQADRDGSPHAFCARGPRGLGETTPLGVVGAICGRSDASRRRQASVREAATHHRPRRRAVAPRATADGARELGQTETERASARCWSPTGCQAFSVAAQLHDRPVRSWSKACTVRRGLPLAHRRRFEEFAGLFVLVSAARALERLPKLFATRGRIVAPSRGARRPGRSCAVLGATTAPEVVQAIVTRAEATPSPRGAHPQRVAAEATGRLASSTAVDGREAIFDAVPKTLAGIVRRASTRWAPLLLRSSVFGETTWVGGIAAVSRYCRSGIACATDLRAGSTRAVAARSVSRQVELVFRHALLRDTRLRALVQKAASQRTGARRCGWR